MNVIVQQGKTQYRVDLQNPLDISIPVSFSKKQLSVFGSAAAFKKSYQVGSFVGDVRKGGSCNCEVYSFSPHLHGTHTECVGHLSKKRIAVHQILKDSLLLASLMTVSETKISRATLEKALSKVDFLEALVVRTLPNDQKKMTRNHDKTPPAYFSADAMRYIVERGIRHVLVDFPSVDKLDDPKLTAHRIFWDRKNSSKTITELIYVPNRIKDGKYLLNLQVSAFDGDAAPSRPVLYKVTRV